MVGRALAVFLALAGLGIACGNADADNTDYGEPPDPSEYDPGRGGNDPYGYGSGSLTGPTKFECPKELKRCAHTITYPVGSEKSVELRGDWGGATTWSDGNGVAMKKKNGKWSADIAVPFDREVQYKFIVDGQWKADPAQPTAEGNDPNNVFEGKTCNPATCEDEGSPPAGVYDWRDAVIYFVFVDRFANGRGSLDAGCRVSGVSGGAGGIADYQGGDWAGVTKKITEGYFNKLGVNTLWITVPFDNPGVPGAGVGDGKVYSGYHGYWPKLASDRNQLAHESCFGSFQDLKDLVANAHKQKLKVLIDYAMVHVHDSSPVYIEHRNDNWFFPNVSPNPDEKDETKKNCVCGSGCSWDDHADRCWFTPYLPHWNYGNQAAADWSADNAVAWINQTKDADGNGIDGFRADAIKHVHLNWLSTLRAKLDSQVRSNPKQRFYMVGETYDFGNRDLLAKYIDPVKKLDGQFDFPLRRYVVESTLMRTMSMIDLAKFMDGNAEADPPIPSNDFFYGTKAVMSTFIGNHDLPRAIHLAANKRLWSKWSDSDSQGYDGKRCDDGRPCPWSNQPRPVADREAFERVANAFSILFTNRGAPLVYYGDEIGLPGAGDPDNRRFMQWTGWTANQNYLHDRIAKLAEIRAAHPALRRGVRQTIGASDDVWLFARNTEGDTVFVAINRSDAQKELPGLPSGSYRELITNTTFTGTKITVPPRQTRILVAK